MFAVTFQHPTPYFDDSYAVNSANNGPYADALLTELIPDLEEQFRMIPEAWVIQVRFTFNSVDDVSNNFTGWLIDDVEVPGTSSCDGGGIP